MQTRQGEIKATIEHTKNNFRKEELQEYQRAFNELSNEIIAMDSGLICLQKKKSIYANFYLKRKIKEEINTLLASQKRFQLPVILLKRMTVLH